MSYKLTDLQSNKKSITKLVIDETNFVAHFLHCKSVNLHETFLAYKPSVTHALNVSKMFLKFSTTP